MPWRFFRETAPVSFLLPSEESANLHCDPKHISPLKKRREPEFLFFAGKPSLGLFQRHLAKNRIRTSAWRKFRRQKNPKPWHTCSAEPPLVDSLAPPGRNANLNCGLVHISPPRNPGILPFSFSWRNRLWVFFLASCGENPNLNCRLAHIAPLKRPRNPGAFSLAPYEENANLNCGLVLISH